MKLLIPLMLLLVLASGSHIPELNKYPGLENSAEKYLGNHETKIVNLDFSREIILHDQGLTSLKLNIASDDNYKGKLLVYDKLPKDFINDFDNLLLDVNTEYTIIDNDPIIVHYIENFDNKFTIEYLFTGKIPYNLSLIENPVFAKPINLPDSRPLSYLLMFIGLLVILYLIQEIRNIRLRGVKIR